VAYNEARQTRELRAFGASRGALDPSATMKLSPQDDNPIE
jgi:hypothetical protein